VRRLHVVQVRPDGACRAGVGERVAAPAAGHVQEDILAGDRIARRRSRRRGRRGCFPGGRLGRRRLPRRRLGRCWRLFLGRRVADLDRLGLLLLADDLDRGEHAADEDGRNREEDCQASPARELGVALGNDERDREAEHHEHRGDDREDDLVGGHEPRLR
jgi:hypothetical protein